MAFLIVYELLPKTTDEQRLRYQDDHIAHISKHVGGLVVQVSRVFSADGSALTGGYVLLDTDKVEEAQAFHEGDPYVVNGLWSTVVFGKVDLPGAGGPPPADASH